VSVTVCFNSHFDDAPGKSEPLILKSSAFDPCVKCTPGPGQLKMSEGVTA
jgi:hypothetical protein